MLGECKVGRENGAVVMRDLYSLFHLARLEDNVRTLNARAPVKTGGQIIDLSQSLSHLIHVKKKMPQDAFPAHLMVCCCTALSVSN